MTSIRARTGTANSALRYGAAMAEREDNRWVTLVLVCLAQFMVILDATIVNIALPTIQQDLDFSQADLQWVDQQLHAVLRRLPAARRPRGGHLRPQADLHRRHDPVQRRQPAQRPRPERRAADRLPRAAGPRRRARLPRRAVDHHHDLPRGPGTHQGARRLERDRGRRRRDRPAARRHPHRGAELGVDLLRQRADRRGRGGAVRAPDHRIQGGAGRVVRRARRGAS